MYRGGRTVSLPVTLDTVSVDLLVTPDKRTRWLIADTIFQVPVFQRGGSVVCRWMGHGSCTAEFQQLPLSITVALSAQVRMRSSAHLAHRVKLFLSAGCSRW